MERILTVGYLNQVKTNKYYTSFSHTEVTEVPKIQLSGKWLENLGYSKGDKIKICAEGNKITIVKL